MTDLYQPLGRWAELTGGAWSIEASAGTGKTFTIATLAARLIAEAQLPIEKLLVVTFTRAGAAELRGRIRNRIQEAIWALSAPSEVHIADPFLADLVRTDPKERLQLLSLAMRNFDAATISTIDSFATQALSSLGSSSKVNFDAQFIANDDDFLRSAILDTCALHALNPNYSGVIFPKIMEVLREVKTILSNPGIRIEPSCEQEDLLLVDKLHAEILQGSLSSIQQRRKNLGLTSYSDQLLQLHAVVSENKEACLSLGNRYSAVLIDEVQDTNPLQWKIFQQIFRHGSSQTLLVFVGDPKQAIYRFRGANIHTYLDATSLGQLKTNSLDTNWRSDGALVDALNRLFSGVTFGDNRIRYHTLNVSAGHKDQQIRFNQATGNCPAFLIRIAPDALRAASAGDRGKKTVTAAVAESIIARDLANHAVHLLSHTEIPNADHGGYRPVTPRDIAVLVNNKNQIPDIQRALHDAGILSVLDRGESVLDSEAATHWKLLLNAMAASSNPRRARAAALSCFLAGESSVTKSLNDEQHLMEIQERLSRWSALLERFGVVDFCHHLFLETRVASRVLVLSGGDRLLTDLEHIASLLQARAVENSQTAAGLLAVLDTLLEDAASVEQDDLTARRVESEDQAVRIMTIHVSKGQEFPIVLIPTLWRAGMIFRQPDYVYEDLRFGRTLDTAKGRYDTLGTIKALALDEVAGEQTRLMYVALTRAKHHCALWWANGQDAHRTALAKVLFARNTDNGAIDPALFEHDGVSVPTDSECVDLLERVFRGGTGASCQITDINSTLASWKGEVKQEEAPLHVALLNRPLVRLQHRWSFSAMIPNQEYVANPDDDALGDAGAFDETLRELSATVPLGAIGAATDLPLGAMPAGAAFGTCVHEIFEHLDFADTALESSLHQIVEEAVRWHGIPADSYELVAGLTKVIESPLGFPLDNRPLRSFGRVDRLDELRFELRLGDGVEHSAPPTNRDIGRLVMHYIEADHPIYGWAERLANEQHVLNLTGHLTGSIDLVLRLRSDEKEPKDRFFIADYKTNSLAPRGRLPLLDDYHPDKLPAAMEEHEYPLQALLYSVVLHRYLRWKLDDYDPECHLGGIAYLFVRGMAGSSTPIVDGNPYGVFNWKLPVGLIEELSSLLHGKVGAR